MADPGMTRRVAAFPARKTHKDEYQVVVAVFGAQHGGDLPQVGGVALLLHTAGEGDGDDPLCDVYQVQLVALVQRLQQTHAPVGQTERLSAFGEVVLKCFRQFYGSVPPIKQRWGWVLDCCR